MAHRYDPGIPLFREFDLTGNFAIFREKTLMQIQSLDDCILLNTPVSDLVRFFEETATQLH